MRQALLENEHDRLCQMLFVSPTERESAVYIIRQEDERRPEKARFIVVSRTFKDHLWPRLLKEMEKASRTKNQINFHAKHEAAPLGGIRTAVESKSAVLDDKSAEVVIQACQDVLSEVRYPKQQVVVRDGATYHACHRSFCGKTQLPHDGTVAVDFVDMETTLRRYAEAPKEQQGPIRADLVQKARQVTARMRRPEVDP